MKSETKNPSGAARGVLDLQGLQALLSALKSEGYRLAGPTRRDRAIVYEEIEGVEDLPAGWTDEQAPGRYRITKGADGALFNYTVGPASWKKFLYPPEKRLWAASRKGGAFALETDGAAPPRYAFIGVRSCELAALATLDKVLGAGDYADADYKKMREAAFIVAVQCGRANSTCFCVSMKTGPRATAGFDLALTEVIEGGRHYFVVETGTERGAAVLGQTPAREAKPEEAAAADRRLAAVEGQMGRSLDTEGLPELLARNFENPHWEEVAKRCLSCANCTLVCPTCFCHTVEDSTDLSGTRGERRRKWDSCFNLDFSYIHGGAVRQSTQSRYRQWMTHKLSNWVGQFGCFGCVGCGRCIVWCPVGIDLTEEAKAIRETDRAAAVSQ